MSARGFIVAVIASIALIGCASSNMAGFRFFKTTQTCTTSSCPIIDVSVEGNPPYVTASIDTLLMKNGNHNANIIWKLNTDGYKFMPDSISFKNPARAATQFSLVNQTNNTFHLKNKNQDDVYAYGYQIKVYETSSGIWIPLDPWVVNN